MIERANSHELNQIFNEAQDKIKRVEKDVDTIKNDLATRLDILKYETEYLNYRATQFLNETPEDYTVCLFEKGVGYFDKYGTDVYAKMTKAPINVFNIQMSGLNSYYFREDMKVTINNKILDSYLDIFKHDTISETLFFEKFESPFVTLTLEVSDLSNILYPTRFNVIEIDSFLQGSFHLQKLRIYQLDEDLNTTHAPITVEQFNQLGKNRIIMPEKYHFYKIEFEFYIDYKTLVADELVYPFGLKHIYFYDADFSEGSYVIVPIHANYNIAIVKDQITVISNQSVLDTTIDAMNVELYMQFENNVLSLPFNASTTNSRYEVALNTDTVYAKIPLKLHESLSCIRFNLEKRVIEDI